jgi:spore coat protein U-like protein
MLKLIKILFLAQVVVFLFWIKVAYADCQITAKPINFGEYENHPGKPLDINGKIVINCRPLAKGTITLNKDNTDSFSIRSAKIKGHRLYYNIYVNAARTKAFGDGTQRSYTISFGPPFPAELPIYGRIFPNQRPWAGSYQAQLSVTATYDYINN